MCDFTFSPSGPSISSGDCTKVAEQKQTFNAVVTPGLSECAYNESASSCPVPTSTGNIDLNLTKSYCTTVVTPSQTVYYFSGPKRADGTAGTITVTFSLKLGLITVTRSKTYSVTCP